MISKIKNLVRSIYESRNELGTLKYFETAALIQTLLSQPRYQDPKNLIRHTAKFFSQFGEDGVLNEIFRRIGTTNSYFVEFGVGNGLENNTCFQLTVNNWQGAWIEGSPESCQSIRSGFSKYIDKGRLRLKNTFITAENIESLFDELGVPTEFDLLSIDIDGNDYHIWKSIRKFNPRVVVVEYNGSFGSTAEKVTDYSPSFVWDGSNHFGSSLKSFELLGKEKGYSLVGVDLAGINAFFVRTDLLKDNFQAPFTSEFHYEAPRYYMQYFGGHPAKVG